MTGYTSVWPAVAEREGFILIVPNGYDPNNDDAAGNSQSWNDCRSDAAVVDSDADDVGFLIQLFDWSVEHLGVNPQARFAVGSSNGGMMVHRLADEAPDTIAAGAALIANRPANSECEPLQQPVPMMIMNGTEDSSVPYLGGSLIGNRGEVLSSQETLDYWLNVNGIAHVPEVARLPSLDNESDIFVKRYIFRSPDSSADVQYYRIEGGGHTTPSIITQISSLGQALVGPQNHDLETAEVVWAFFREFARPRETYGPGLTGLWFDPQSSGEGFTITSGETGTVIYYYGRSNADHPLWLVSEVIEPALALDTQYETTFFEVAEGSFDQPVAPPESLVAWGSLEIEFHSCSQATAELNSDSGKVKRLDLVPLLGVAGAKC